MASTVTDVEQEDPADSLDVLVKTSDDNKIISMYVVNYGTQTRNHDMFFNNFIPEEDVTVTQLGPNIKTARNSDENPDMISPVVKNEKIGKKKFNMNSLHIALLSSMATR